MAHDLSFIMPPLLCVPVPTSSVDMDADNYLKEKVIVNLKGCCALCLADPNEIACDDGLSNFNSTVVTEIDIRNLWLNIFSNWNEFPRKEFTFLSRGSMSSAIPSVCHPCSLKIAKISNGHNQIVELERQLEALRKEMGTTVESIRRQMREVTVPSNRRKEGLKSSRFKRLLLEISEQSRLKERRNLEMENTILYLGLVGGCKLYNPLQSANSGGTPSSSTLSANVASGSSDCVSASALLKEQRKTSLLTTLARKIIQTSSKPPVPASEASSPVKRPKIMIASSTPKITFVTSLQKEEKKGSSSLVTVITDDVKSEDEADFAVGNGCDDVFEMDPLGDNDNDEAPLQFHGSRQQNLVSLKRKLSAHLPQPKRKNEATLLPDIDIDEDSDDSEDGMDSNGISSALNLFRANLRDASATTIALQKTSFTQIARKIKSVESKSESRLTVVKETHKVTLRSPSSTSKSSQPRVVTLKSGLTTTELDPNMTIAERIAFFRRTFVGRRRRKPKKVPLGYPCLICHSIVKLKEMYAHLKEAHHLEDYVFNCPNYPKCERAFFSKYSISYYKHLKKRKACWNAAGSPPLEEFKCPSCSQSFPRTPRKLFQSHLESCHENETSEKLFKCPMKDCKEEYTLKESVELHLITHCHSYSANLKNRNKSLQICNLCPHIIGRGRTRLKPEMMLKHLKNTHGIENDDILKCAHCTRVFGSRADLFNHWRVHLKNGKPISCDICKDDKNFTSTRMFRLRDHYFKEHGIGEVLLCEYDYCEYSTYSKENLLHHRTTHDRSYSFSCEHCSRKFETLEQMEKHSKKCIQTKLPFKCKYSCKTTFATEEERDAHEEAHFANCEHCGKLMLRHRINTHVRDVHVKGKEREKGYKCEDCGKVFKQRRDLTVHKDVDHLGNFIVCEKCGMQCRSKWGLTKHKKEYCKGIKLDEPGNEVKKPTRPIPRGRFECPHCDKVFDLRRSWVTHIDVDHNGKLFVCGKCGVTCRTRYGLSQHENKFCKIRNPNHWKSGKRTSTTAQSEEEEEAYGSSQT